MGSLRVLLKVAPFVGGVLALRLFLCHVVGFTGLLEFSDVGLVLTGGIFLIGFMLSGVMSDYKESEKIPADLACVLEAIASTFFLCGECKNIPNTKDAVLSVQQLTKSILSWLHGKETQANVYKAIELVELHSFTADKAGAGPYANRALTEATTVRKIVTRIAVIARTNFLPAGYVLMNSVTAAVVILLFVTQFKSLMVECILVSFVSLIFFYMVFLIMDLDNPFEYNPDQVANGSAEVALFPLTEFSERLERMLDEYNAKTHKKSA
jgi:hypothetical protein